MPQWQHYLIGFLPFLHSVIYTPTDASWDHLPNKSLALKSLSQGLLLGEPKLRQLLLFKIFVAQTNHQIWSLGSGKGKERKSWKKFSVSDFPNLEGFHGKKPKNYPGKKRIKEYKIRHPQIWRHEAQLCQQYNLENYKNYFFNEKIRLPLIIEIVTEQAFLKITTSNPDVKPGLRVTALYV